MPGSSFAGSSGCAPGGTTHISGSLWAGACFPRAINSEDAAAASSNANAAEATCFMRQV